MFINQNRLEHLLTPPHYFSPEHHDLELERIFLPSWHLLASKADLPKNGDFLTIEVFGRPLILRNFDGDYRAFINVCAHRHCLLTSVPRGNSTRFVCQYHGWEYNREGRTGRIPDARCFRPWDRENAHLKVVRTETCGDLIFICLDQAAPSLADYLEPYYSIFSQAFASPYRQAWTFHGNYNANWKVFIENSLESYHIPSVHTRTLSKLPPENACSHELTDRYTWFKTLDKSIEPLSWCVRRFGLKTTHTYEHHNLHPHLTFSCSDGLGVIQTVLPTSPTTCRHDAWLFTVRGDTPGWLGEAFGWLLARSMTLYIKAIFREDIAIYADVQRGLQASTVRGVIGTREERVYAFQKYVLDHCTAPAQGRAIALA
jgi:choline monooxygenase